MEKNPSIAEALAHLRRRLGSGAFDVLDYWPDDPDTIGIARPGDEEPCVCILTAGKAAGRFDLQHGGELFPDCVIQGVEWVVRQELLDRAKPDAPPGGWK